MPSLKKLALIATADFIENNPQHWTQAAMARLPNNDTVHPLHPDACKHCALGRLAYEAHQLGIFTLKMTPYNPHETESAYDAIQKAFFKVRPIFETNDSPRDSARHDVVALLRRLAEQF